LTWKFFVLFKNKDWFKEEEEEEEEEEGSRSKFLRHSFYHSFTL
jgi:hypothetical protein